MKNLRRGYQFKRTVMFVDDRNEKASVDGEPSWDSSDTAIINLVPDPDGDPYTIVVQAVGMVGSSATVTVSADADLGDGIEPVMASDDIHVVSGQATSAGFTDTEPEPIPEEA